MYSEIDNHIHQNLDRNLHPSIIPESSTNDTLTLKTLSEIPTTYPSFSKSTSKSQYVGTILECWRISCGECDQYRSTLPFCFFVSFGLRVTTHLPIPKNTTQASKGSVLVTHFGVELSLVVACYLK